MKTAAVILKYCAIILNSLLAILLTMAAAKSGPNGIYLVMFSLVVSCSIINVIVLALSKYLLARAIGIFTLCLSSVLNLFSLGCVLAGIIQYGIPTEQPIATIAVIMWLAFPIVTLPALFILRAQLNKKYAGVLQEHIAFNVEDPVAVAEWYCLHVGLKKVGGSGAAFFIADASGHGILEIYKHDEAPVPDYASMHPMALHIAFVSKDVEADEAKLIAAGATKYGETIREYGNTIAMLRDPWGLAIQLAHRERPML